MPLFRPKTSKNIIVDVKSNVTLDNKHEEFKKILYNNDIEIKNLIIEKKNKNLILENENNIITKIELKENIDIIKKKIKSLKKFKKDYYLNNSKFLFDYFENKKQISIDNYATKNNNIKKLDKFFNINCETVNEENNNIFDKSDTVKKYLRNIDDEFFDMDNFVYDSDVCIKCKKGELINVDFEGISVCNNPECGKTMLCLVENEKPSYKEPPKEVCFYAYKRINHFREIIAQFQAKESTNIPTKVLEDIKKQISKERLEITQFTNNKAKDILKKLGYNKYYEHIPFIKDKLGIKPPIMSPELEEKLCNLFMEIQTPYAKFCPDNRVNFLNYYYTIYKLCELLNKREFLPYFPMLKDRDKRIEQDIIWKKICKELDWKFIPTV